MQLKRWTKAFFLIKTYWTKLNVSGNAFRTRESVTITVAQGRNSQRMSVDALTRAFASDLELAVASSDPPIGYRSVAVYTAFDGDHFALVPMMRNHVIRRGLLPVDPEGCLGYRPSVRRYNNKSAVLLS